MIFYVITQCCLFPNESARRGTVYRYRYVIVTASNPVVRINLLNSTGIGIFSIYMRFTIISENRPYFISL